jgi:MFS family permease
VIAAAGRADARPLHDKAGPAIFVLLYAAALLASVAEGFFLLLPLYVKHAGGNEISVGWILWGGAIGSVLLVGAMTRLLAVLRPAMIAALGCASFASGAAIFAFTDHIGWYSIVAGFLQGAGVGLSVASYPMVISGLIEDGKRSVHFSVLAAFGIAGMGVSPVIANILTHRGIGYTQIFLASALLCAACVIMFVFASRIIRAAETVSAKPAPAGALRLVMASEAAYPLSMVFLGTCMFTSMMNFQTTFAANRGLDFQIFYACYIAAAIVARFALSHAVNRANPLVMTVVLLAVVCGSLASYSFIGGSALLYGIASALLGGSYGLAYPLIQAHAVNLTAPELREKVLAYFSFSYFTAAFGFPLVSGWVIVRFGYDAFLVLLLAVGVAELGVGTAHWRANYRARTLPPLNAPGGRLGLSA